MLNSYTGFYSGIIVQNNDPDHAGKVKVWVPHISPTVYAGWINKVQENKRFKFLGANVAEQFTMVVEDIKQILPWADIALPLTNECATGRYFANSQYGTISDSNNTTYVKANSSYNKPLSQNSDNIGEKPANIYEQTSTSLTDDFNTTNNNVVHINPFAHNYKPSSYSNCSKGEFGIPSVGAHVWVFFKEGDVNYPVVCFASYGEMDWNSLYNDNDYPGDSENVHTNIGTYTHNVDKYRSKYILNQKGGTVEIINTDHNEKVKITHYSGSFKEFNNNVTTELATGNDQKLILGNQYNTVKGHKSEAIKGDYDCNVKGDMYIKVGNLNMTAFRAWKTQMVDVADTRQKFDIQRTDDKIQVLRGKNVMLKLNSSKQTKSGVNAPNSVLNYSISAFTNSQLRGGSTESKFEDGIDTAYTKKQDNTQPPEYTNSYYNKQTAIKKKNPSKDAKLPELSPSSMGGTFAPTPKQAELASILNNSKLKDLFEAESQMGIGGSEIKHITKDKIETVGMLLNDFGSMRIDTKGKYYASEMKISNDTSYVNKAASPLIEYVYVDDFPGGTYTVNANNRYNLLVGAGGMYLKSYGVAEIGGTITNISGEQINIGSRNEINITCDKRIDISADIISLRQKHQKQVLVDSSLGISKNIIIGGKTYMEQEVYLHHITAPREIQATYPSTVWAKPEKDEKGALGTFEVTLNGFTHGESPHQHSMSDVKGVLTFTKCTYSNPDSIVCHAHGHNFDNIPLTLMDSNSAIREAAHKAEIDV